MNPITTSFEDCDQSTVFKIINKETQTESSFIFGGEDSKGSFKSQKSNRLPLPRDYDTDDCIKVYSFCQILQDPDSPRSVTLIKDSVSEEVRDHKKSSKDAVANRYKYCREVIKPFLKDYPQDCADSDEKIIQDAINSASEDFPDYQPCTEFFPSSLGKIDKTLDKSDNKNSLGISEKRGPGIPVKQSKPIIKQSKQTKQTHPKTSNKKCNTEKASKQSLVDRSTNCTPKTSLNTMDNKRECPSKSSLNSCPDCPPGIPVRQCSPSKVCPSSKCPTKSNPPKTCPLRDCPPKSCNLKDCPPDVCPPKECDEEACPPEYSSDGAYSTECPLAETPRKCGSSSKCSNLDCTKKSRPISESSSNKDVCQKKTKRPTATNDENKKCIVYDENSPREKCPQGSSSSINMNKVVDAHNETIATLKNAMEDFMGKVFKTTQDAVSTITSESSKQIEKFRKCGSSSASKGGENNSDNIASFNFVRKVESKGKTDDTCKDGNNDGAFSKFVRKVESTVSVVSETVVNKIPDNLKPGGKYNDTGSPYDTPTPPKKCSNEILQDPTSTVISNSVFSSIKTRICSMFCDKEQKTGKSVSQKSSCSSKDNDDETIIERLIE